jgi:myxalamid-type nonribosomal peptide synthetase MxaA
MLSYHIWRDDYQKRIIALRGDLAQSCFGLDSEIYASLVDQIDLIFHCAATVNFVLPYSQLYGSNVCGTREIIRLATHTTSTCIPVHYISTISVLPPGVDKEISIAQTSPDRLIGGYAQSKWVAEKMMANASHCGLPMVIYRLGLICADTTTGACNEHDLYTLLFAAMMTIGCYPESAVNGHINGLPVNFTAKSIVYLSEVQPDVYGKIYHVVNWSSEISFEEIIDGMRDCGIQLESASRDEWQMKVKTITDRNGRFESARKILLDISFRENYIVSAKHFSSAVDSLEFPSLDKDYVFKWLTFILDNIVRK